MKNMLVLSLLLLAACGDKDPATDDSADPGPDGDADTDSDSDSDSDSDTDSDTDTDTDSDTDSDSDTDADNTTPTVEENTLDWDGVIYGLVDPTTIRCGTGGFFYFGVAFDNPDSLYDYTLTAQYIYDTDPQGSYETGELVFTIRPPDGSVNQPADPSTVWVENDGSGHYELIWNDLELVNSFTGETHISSGWVTCDL